MRKELFVAVSALSLAAGAWLACGSDGAQPGPTARPEGVVVERVAPGAGPLGTEVVLHGSGFTADDNDVGFTNPAISFHGQHTGYLNGLASPDGTTLRFNLPDNDGVLLSACPYSQLMANEACPDIGLLLPTGQSDVFVVNEHGKSTSVTFFVVGSTTDQPNP